MANNSVRFASIAKAQGTTAALYRATPGLFRTGRKVRRRVLIAKRRGMCWQIRAARGPQPRRFRWLVLRPTGRPEICGTEGAGPADGIGVTPMKQPSARRRIRVQPAQWRPGGYGRNGLDCRPRERTSAEGWKQIERVPYEWKRSRAKALRNLRFPARYVEALDTIIDFDAIREAGVKIGADPLGGASPSTGRKSPITTRSTSPW